MNTRPRTRIASGLVTLALIVAAWLLLAPTQFGGRTGYAVVKGNSMEPMLHQGDLAIVRRTDDYEVGDAVLYASETLDGAHVLHRVVRLESGRFVARGDNRAQDDADRFTDEAVVGKLWFSIPVVGSSLVWLGSPLPLAVFIFVLAFAILAGGREVSRRRAAPRAPEVRVKPVDATTSGARWTSASRSVLAAGLGAGLLFGALALLSWTRPESRVDSVPGGYVHSGTYSYSAKVARSPVYPDGEVATGEAMFTELVDRVRFAFDYHFSSLQPSAIRGGIGLDAVLSDGNGWTRSLPLAPLEPFEGPDAHVDGVLDLRRVASAVTSMRALTQANEPSFMVTITPRVQAAGYAGTTVVDSAFEPGLAFRYDQFSLRLAMPEGETEPLTPRQEGETTAWEDTTLGIGPLTLTTADVRAFSGVGLFAALLLVSGSALLLARTARTSPADVLHLRYADRLVEAQVVIPESRWVSDVRDAESLGVIAEHYDRVILHTVEGGADVYLVDDGVAVYRYRDAGATVPTSHVSLAGG